MRKKIATAMVCLAFCLSTNSTDTTFAHNHQEVISEVTDANEMMIDDESAIKRIKEGKVVLPKVENTIKLDSIPCDTIRQQKSNQTTNVVRKVRVTYYYPTGNRTATGHSAKGHERIIALSPDLLKLIPYHSKVELEGYGIFTVEDRTSSSLRNTVDVLIPKGTKIKNGKNVVMKVVNT